MQLRNLSIPTGAVFAPMAGLTDAACRHLMADHGAAWTVSEMASAKALNFHDENSWLCCGTSTPTACTPSSCSARSRSRWPRQFCL